MEPVPSASQPPQGQGLALVGRGKQPGRLTPPSLLPQPWGRSLHHKGKLVIRPPNCFLPRVGTRNSRLPLVCLSQVSARGLARVHGEDLGGVALAAWTQTKGSHRGDAGAHVCFFPR